MVVSMVVKNLDFAKLNHDGAALALFTDAVKEVVATELETTAQAVEVSLSPGSVKVVCRARVFGQRAVLASQGSLPEDVRKTMEWHLKTAMTSQLTKALGHHLTSVSTGPLEVDAVQADALGQAEARVGGGGGSTGGWFVLGLGLVAVAGAGWHFSRQSGENPMLKQHLEEEPFHASGERGMDLEQPLAPRGKPKQTSDRGQGSHSQQGSAASGSHGPPAAGAWAQERGHDGHQRSHAAEDIDLDDLGHLGYVDSGDGNIDLDALDALDGGDPGGGSSEANWADILADWEDMEEVVYQQLFQQLSDGQAEVAKTDPVFRHFMIANTSADFDMNAAFPSAHVTSQDFVAALQQHSVDLTQATNLFFELAEQHGGEILPRVAAPGALKRVAEAAGVHVPRSGIWDKVVAISLAGVMQVDFESWVAVCQTAMRILRLAVQCGLK